MGILWRNNVNNVINSKELVVNYLGIVVVVCKFNNLRENFINKELYGMIYLLF